MKPGNFLAKHESVILGTGFIVLLLVIWESVSLWYTLPRGMALFFTTPTKIAAAFYELLLNGEIEKHFYVSAVAFLAGLGLSIIVGLPVGLIIGRSPTLEAWLDPYITPHLMRLRALSYCHFSSFGLASVFGRRS